MENNEVKMTAQQSQAIATIADCAKLDLSKATTEPVELSGEYWTPEKEGETKRMFFVQLMNENVIELDSGETRELPVVQFVENRGGALHTVRNGSRRLYGIFEQFAHQIKPGDAFEITYLGKKKNKNNSFFSDNWQVRRLIINAQ